MTTQLEYPSWDFSASWRTDQAAARTNSKSSSASDCEPDAATAYPSLLMDTVSVGGIPVSADEADARHLPVDGVIMRKKLMHG